MPQLDTELWSGHIFAVTTALIIMYGHETSYGLFKVIEAIKVRKDYMLFAVEDTIFLLAERDITKTFISNILLNKPIL
jgi:hypothetical protein